MDTNWTETIELRRGGAREGDKAVFQCGRNILRGIIVKKEECSKMDVLRQNNYKSIIPSANNLEDAITYLKGLYGTVKGRFTTFLKPSYRLSNPIMKESRQTYNPSQLLSTIIFGAYLDHIRGGSSPVRTHIPQNIF